jgi:hypothetical protein
MEHQKYTIFERKNQLSNLVMKLKKNKKYLGFYDKPKERENSALKNVRFCSILLLTGRCYITQNSLKNSERPIWANAKVLPAGISFNLRCSRETVGVGLKGSSIISSNIAMIAYLVFLMTPPLLFV